MSERARNLAVGLMVLVGIALLGVLITVFSVLPGLFHRGYVLRIETDATHGVAPGLPVHLRGIRVGQITEVGFRDANDPAQGVLYTALIDNGILLPANAKAVLSTAGFVGALHLELSPSGPPAIDARTGQPLAVLPTDGSAVLKSVEIGGNDLIPPDLQEALRDMRPMMKEAGTLVHNLNELFTPPPGATTGPAGQPAQGQIQGMLANLDRSLNAIADIFGDANTQGDIKTALANLARASRHLPQLTEDLQAFVGEARKTLQDAGGAMNTVTGVVDKTGKQFDVLAAKVVVNLDKLSELTTLLTKVAAKIDSGEGTAGKLLNDPKLYSNFLEISSQIKKLLTDLQALTEQWEKSGVGIRIK